MEQEELDNFLDELEVRLERLRALYEQYFLGIEKIEPSIARKDVDRRIYLLRREKIRNTGKRFKLQTLIQRYNTFQQYWQRICREIENGTYKRHLARAEKIGPTELLTVATRRRFGMDRGRAQETTAAAGAKPPLDPSAASAAPAPASAAPRPAPPSTAPAPKPPGSATPAPVPPPPPARTPPAPMPSAPMPAPRAPRAPAPARPAQFESLELDMDFLGDWDPERAAPRPATVNAPPPAEKAPARVGPPPKPAREQRRVPTSPGLAPPALPLPMQSPAEAAPRPAVPRPATSPPRPALPVPAASSASAPPAAPRPRPAPAAPRPQPKPAAAMKSELPAEAKPARNTEPKAAPATGLNEGRLRELHSKLLEENRKANQPAVSLEGLSRSLRSAEAKLRAQHGSNRRIEFEVILKDGKPVVKPIVR